MVPARSSTSAEIFFKDYVRNDGPAADALPDFIRASRGDYAALNAIFTDYARYGSGDSEAWGDVPDVLLEQIGDERFARYLDRQELAIQLNAVKFLGAPGSNLYEDAESKKTYPRTAEIQKSLFSKFPSAIP
jgi:hypothetical protein